MDLLKKEGGATIIETMTGIIIFGLALTLSFAIFTKLFSSPTVMHKQEAFQLANQEITNSINAKAMTDTTYKNSNGNLLIERKIISQERLFDVTVKVFALNKTQEVVSLSGKYVQ